MHNTLAGSPHQPFPAPCNSDFGAYCSHDRMLLHGRIWKSLIGSPKRSPQSCHAQQAVQRTSTIFRRRISGSMAPSQAAKATPLDSPAPDKTLTSATQFAAQTQHAHADPTWHYLGVSSRELRLEFTLPTGQSFRWRQMGEGHFTGVIGTRLVEMRQLPDDVQYRVLARGPSSSSPPDNTAQGSPSSLQQPASSDILTGSASTSTAQGSIPAPGSRQGPGLSEHDLDDAAVREYFNLTRCGRIAAVFGADSSVGGGTGASGSIEGGCGSSGHLAPETGATLAELVDSWMVQDARFAAISPYFPGARMLRQDPVECLFQFICSSNNHISRIHGMVERLCSAYGKPLPHTFTPGPEACAGAPGAPQTESTSQGEGQVAGADAGPGGVSDPVSQGSAYTAERAVGGLLEGGGASPGPVKSARGDEAGAENTPPPVRPASAGSAAAPLRAASRRQRKAALPASAGAAASATASVGTSEPMVPAKAAVKGAAPAGLSFYAFPTLEELSVATEQELRDAGFGYRAKFITGSVAALLAKEGGGHAWLMGLRQQPYRTAVEQLCTLPGIGPKVAACVCLFSLDKHEAIPVDTHVWQIATRYYLPHLKGKALTKKVHEDVQRAFEQRFGAFAGWAHNTLFISELASQRERLPEALRPAGASGKKRKARQASSDDSADDSEG